MSRFLDLYTKAIDPKNCGPFFLPMLADDFAQLQSFFRKREEKDLDAFPLDAEFVPGQGLFLFAESEDDFTSLGAVEECDEICRWLGVKMKEAGVAFVEFSGSYPPWRLHANGEVETQVRFFASDQKMGEKPLLETTIEDWRCSDGDEESVWPQHRGPYQIKVLRSGYGGLWIDVISPQGHASSLLLEGEEGALKVNTYSPEQENPCACSDDPDVILHIDPRGTHVMTNVFRGGAFLCKTESGLQSAQEPWPGLETTP